MKRSAYLNIFSFILISASLILGCAKEEEPPFSEPIPEANEVNSFIWNGMHDYYLWNADVYALSNRRFAKADSLNFFLNQFTDPEKLFTRLLYKYEEVDKWSFIVEDSKTIDDWISGISKTMGYDFRLDGIQFTNKLFGFVRYVVKGSPADKAGMKRGDIFLTVNDEQLTTSNYQKLLFETETQKLGFATIKNSTIYPSARTVNMTAVELQENPIHKDTIFISSNQKIGYLVYNGFNGEFDLELNNVFKKFKDANINQLVLDLRYNGGGSVRSCIYLASMIYGTDDTKVFAKSKYNQELQAYLEKEYGSSSLNDYFTKTIEKTDKTPATPINTLNLQKVYFIVSDNTASASELLINGLMPYMSVTVVGINTDGKYTGSMTIKDWDAQGNVNPNHKWAMQPIVVKYANSIGQSDFVKGLTPNILAEEDYASLKPFGDPNEDLLKVVLGDISGIPIVGTALKSAEIGLTKVADSRDFKPFAKEMYINLPGKKSE